MKRLILFVLTILPLTVLAQTRQPVAGELSADSTTTTVCFGYLSYDAALMSMPEYAVAQDSIKAEHEAYEKEMKRVEDEFNQKYELFLEGQREFPRTILLKRQNELQELMQRNVDFKAQARQELRQAEERLMQPLHDRLREVLAAVAREFGLALVINTDTNACPFIDPRMGMNIQEEVESYLK